MLNAMAEFSTLSQAQIGKITMEIVLLGQKGLQINNPDVRYSLESKPGDFSALQLGSIMHVRIKLLDPHAVILPRFHVHQIIGNFLMNGGFYEQEGCGTEPAVYE